MEEKFIKLLRNENLTWDYNAEILDVESIRVDREGQSICVLLSEGSVLKIPFALLRVRCRSTTSYHTIEDYICGEEL